MSLSCLSRPRGQDMGAISHPLYITESRFMALSIYSLLAHTWKHHSLYSSTNGWADGELSQCLFFLFPSSISRAGSIPCCVCGFCCLLAAFIAYATGVEWNPLSSLVLGSFAGWHWRYIWTLGTVLLERQVRICQNTTVYMCRGKRRLVSIPRVSAVGSWALFILVAQGRWQRSSFALSKWTPGFQGTSVLADPPCASP